MTTSYTCADARCPRCAATLTGATGLPGDNSTPSADDLSVCTYCGAVLVFNNDLTLREATRVDLETLPSAVEWKLALAIGTIRLLNQKDRNGTH